MNDRIREKAAPSRWTRSKPEPTAQTMNDLLRRKAGFLPEPEPDPDEETAA